VNKVNREQLRRLAKRDPNSVWRDKPEDPELWSFMLGRTRDSDHIENSNYELVLQDFEKAFPDSENLRDERWNHWAVGWVDHLIVKVCNRLPVGDEEVPTTAEFQWLCRIKEKLSNYPIYNEDDVSEREFTERMQDIVHCMPELRGPTPSEEVPSEVYRHLSDRGAACMEYGDTPDQGDVRDALRELGWIEDADGVFHEPCKAGNCQECGKRREPSVTAKQYAIVGEEMLPVFPRGWVSDSEGNWWCSEHPPEQE